MSSCALGSDRAPAQGQQHQQTAAAPQGEAGAPQGRARRRAAGQRPTRTVGFVLGVFFGLFFGFLWSAAASMQHFTDDLLFRFMLLEFAGRMWYNC